MRTKGGRGARSRLRHMAVIGALALGASSGAALAEERSWYAGARLGYANAAIGSADLTSRLAARGHTTVQAEVDDKAPGVSLYGGLRLQQAFYIEGGLYAFGPYDVTVTGTSSNPIGLARDLAAEQPSGAMGLSVAGRFLLPMRGTPLYYTTRVGAMYWATERDIRTPAGNVSESKDGIGLLFGAGVGYALSSALRVEGGFEIDRLDSDNVTTQFVAGIEYVH